jgi:hypothetical protein
MCHRTVTPMAASGGAVNNASAAVPSDTGNVTFPGAQPDTDFEIIYLLLCLFSLNRNVYQIKLP